ncbi:MAG: CZB domain-containing protein [Magnetococcus sp. DMHC-8]
MTPQLDITFARLAHVMLEAQLETALQGKGPTGPGAFALPARHRCELGLWLGQHEPPHALVERDAYLQLVMAHDQFHDKAERVIHHLTVTPPTLPPSRLAEEMAQFRLLSRDMVFLLTSLELAYLNEQHRSAWLAHPLKNLLHRLFDDHPAMSSGETEILDISHARLAHVRWQENLCKSFRHRGRHFPMDAEENCVLGNWVRNVGLPGHADLAEMTMLDQAHQQFHAQADKTVQCLQRRQDRRAEQAYAEMLTASREIVYLLSIIESKLLDAASIHRTPNLIR